MNFQLLFKYLSYKFTARHKYGYGIHSPFVFDLLTKTIRNFKSFNCYKDIENIRKTAKHSKKIIEVEDFGAGSHILKSNKRKIKDIAKYSLTKKKYSQLLFRLVNHFKPETILEFGTSLGITTIYLAKGNSDAKVISLEGSKKISDEAKNNFKKLNIKNIKLITGEFDKTLPKALSGIKNLDFVFFDGNHTKDATLSYFNQCLPYVLNDTVFVFDDIHWSEQMEEAWEKIKKHKKITVTIDLFFMGFVFFRKENYYKQDFKIRF
ncbi:MAG: class I SAM-dependent methyltransferase [Bacteroidetes bacterium]|nr:class I SAM-dependent methyltransferase [Bacteroidota bacterium]